VAATCIAGIPEIIIDGRNGFLFEPGNPEALAKIFARIESSPDTLSRLDPMSETIRLIDEEADDLLRLFSDRLLCR
jgi:glycosyltransferase involved in cell wall biosynthesis